MIQNIQLYIEGAELALLLVITAAAFAGNGSAEHYTKPLHDQRHCIMYQ